MCSVLAFVFLLFTRQHWQSIVVQRCCDVTVLISTLCTTISPLFIIYFIRPIFNLICYYSPSSLVSNTTHPTQHITLQQTNGTSVTIVWTKPHPFFDLRAVFLLFPFPFTFLPYYYDFTIEPAPRPPTPPLPPPLFQHFHLWPMSRWRKCAVLAFFTACTLSHSLSLSSQWFYCLYFTFFISFSTHYIYSTSNNWLLLV